MIPITKPTLPDIRLYQRYIEEIWSRNWLTNNGPLVNELELKLKDYLDVPHFLYLSNGTIAIQLAIKALGLKGGIITTPFSYVATTSSIVWENCRPQFVDIDRETFNLDPRLIEQAITKDTTAILATHVYGNPCDVEAIAAIATKHNLKVIYDAAHCFGTLYDGKSVFNYGDISTTSFHATKLFQTVEGGAVFTQDAETLSRLASMRNFGHDGPDVFAGVGINGKNSEFHAAMGLANLPKVDQVLAKRKADHLRYDALLHSLKLQKPKIAEKATYNYCYYPVVFPTQEMTELVFRRLKENEIFARRYFYPVLSSLNYVDAVSMPVAEDIAERVLCLPIYETISAEEIDLVSRLVIRTVKYGR
ncbi:MAG: DegT/DnrJ/EryC1/StrS family aminotransferase [Lewinella sp.]